MKCNNCGHNNAPAKRSCERCFKILSGYTFNNVTGEYGYRNSDGSFTKKPKGKNLKLKNTKSSKKPSHIFYSLQADAHKIMKDFPDAVIFILD